MDNFTKDWKNWQKATVGLLIVFIIASGAIATFRYATRVVSPMPEEVRSQVNFAPLVVSEKSKNFTTDSYKYLKVEDGTEILNYSIHSEKGFTVAVSQYEQPPQFTEIPDYQNRFLTNVAKQYDTVQTSAGVIYLGRLSKQDNKQVGVMLDKGLIVFLSPNKDLDKDQWRSVGNVLRIENLDN